MTGFFLVPARRNIWITEEQWANGLVAPSSEWCPLETHRQFKPDQMSLSLLKSPINFMSLHKIMVFFGRVCWLRKQFCPVRWFFPEPCFDAWECFILHPLSDVSWNVTSSGDLFSSASLTCERVKLENCPCNWGKQWQSLAVCRHVANKKKTESSHNFLKTLL